MDKGTVTISVPRTMEDFIAGTLRESRISTPSEYICALICDPDMTRNGDIALLLRRHALHVETATRPSSSKR